VNIAFGVVFGVFVAAILGLAVVAVRWGVRRDRVSRALRTEPGAVARGPDESPVAGPASDTGAT
jgi:hypothetical protein